MKKTTDGNGGVVEASKDVGINVVHEFAGLKVTVTVTDVKFAYGKKRWKVRVKDQASSNELWIDAPKG